MHNSLKGLPKRVVIDANVLMDAAFVRDGAARISLAMLRKMGYSAVVDKNIEFEAIEKLRDYRTKYCPDVDLAKLFVNYISSDSVISLPAAPQVSNSSVNKMDIHVLSAAAHYGTWVLTGDLALNVELHNSGIEPRIPFDVITEGKSSTEGLSLDLFFHIVAPTRQRGLIFGRVNPGMWAGSTSATSHTVFEMENVGRILYNNQANEWVFKMRTGDSVKIKCPIQQGEEWAVCGSYDLSGNGDPGKITLRAGMHPSKSFAQTVKSTKALTSATAGKSTLGHTANGQHFWNGHFLSIVVGPQGIGRDSWKNLLAIPYGAPNPYDSDALSRVLKRLGSLNTQPSQIRLPTEHDLRNLKL